LAGIYYDHIERLRRLMDPGRGSGRVNLPRLEAQRSFDVVRLRALDASLQEPARAPSVRLAAPGTYELPGADCQVRLTVSESIPGAQGHQRNRGRDDNKEEYNGEQRKMLDWERLPKPLILRSWQPGDRYHPWGRTRPAKLKTLFQRHRVPAWARPHWPVLSTARQDARCTQPPFLSGNVESGETVVWAYEFGPAREYAAGPESHLILEIATIWAGDGKKLEI
jgi:tRNA(Ile)-lysidine synthase